ncbi:hypothetical protein BFP72_18835 [Reichenbachiella sp. 5M10]|uniref:hypothetical protein n=1 Tax=Reichenbachiella sp. 5M10 TaxID=1889772 RepID=UPI000C14AB8A|nr:hypothetical protein [Reichenbachiella sp. 5M10]PIB34497.1 hypothetical protein BFP72_03245 [Reichenbachiella sp. 5M10]PIB34575.1 hypothetical protein BFP72_03700 [Reichenbachiella sp. 5M10]PIB37733.1 hypothetical protein BFP72_18835 [Reichenbachiella sp. 5M10]
MRSKKLRGLKRRQKNIDKWFEGHQRINLEILKESKYYYCKSKVDPWSNLYYEVDYPANYRRQLFSHLLSIYELWKKQLEDNFDDFYLAIWLNDRRFIDSQVVSAIGDRAEHYQQMWNLHEEPLKFPIKLFNNEEDRVSMFHWDSTEDEDLVFESEYSDLDINDYWSPEDFFDDVRSYRKLVKNNTPTRTIQTEDGIEKAFVLKRGNTWIGKQK